LIAALKGSHEQVREQAVIGIVLKGDQHLIEHLIAALTDVEWSVREQAAIALGKPDVRGDERAVQPLLAALLDSEWAVREIFALWSPLCAFASLRLCVEFFCHSWDVLFPKANIRVPRALL
jgi:HEAT repeat protein